MASNDDKVEETTIPPNATASTTPPKKPNKPDDHAHKAKMKTHDDTIANNVKRIDAIKLIVDSRDKPKGDSPAVAAERTKFNAARAEARRLIQEKRAIFDQIGAADELKKQQQDLVNRLKADLPYFSAEEIERKIKQLEHSQQTTSLTIKEDKACLEQIKKLSSSKPLVRQFHEAQESLKAVKEHHNELYTQLKAKNTLLAVAKEAEDKCRTALDAVRAKEDEKRADLPALLEERDALRKAIAEARDAIKQIRDDYYEEKKQWFAYQKVERDRRQKEWAEKNAVRDAERAAIRAQKEAEEALRDPWETEKLVCEQLLGWAERYLPKTAAVVKTAAAAVEVPAGMVARKRDDDDDAPVLGKKKKGARAGGGGKVAKPLKLTLTPDNLSMFGMLAIQPPADAGACVRVHEELLAKREWLKTAPPKKKPEKKKPEAAPAAPAADGKPAKKDEPPPTADTQLELTGLESQADADALQAALAAVEGVISATVDLEAAKAKVVGSPGFPTEDKLVEAVVAAGFSAKVTRLAGGLFKYDPTEVDVNGGDATADDFMDAFGFGGDDDGEVAAESEEEEAAPAPAPEPAKPAKKDEPPPTADTQLELTGLESQADADALQAALAAVEGVISATVDLEAAKAKVVGSPGFPTEDKLVEAVVAAGFSAKVTRLAGGLFKYDPTEVDVNGGDATADDFMDAFGFGGDDDGEVAAESEEEEAAPAPAPEPAKPAKKDEPPPTADTQLELTGLESQADADALQAALAAVEGVISATVDLEAAKAKVVGSPGFPTEDKLVEAVVAAGFSAKVTRLAGGLFKYDPAEVDVNGGDATADDFMDAFGF